MVVVGHGVVVGNRTPASAMQLTASLLFLPCHARSIQFGGESDLSDIDEGAFLLSHPLLRIVLTSRGAQTKPKSPRPLVDPAPSPPALPRVGKLDRSRRTTRKKKTRKRKQPPRRTMRTLLLPTGSTVLNARGDSRLAGRVRWRN